MKNHYQELLDRPEWKERATLILKLDKNTCQCCGTKTGTKHVHHRYYLPNLYPWEYKDAALITLCEKCHIEEHIWKRLYKETFNEVLESGYSFKDLYELSYLLIDAGKSAGVRVSVEFIKETLKQMQFR